MQGLPVWPAPSVMDVPLWWADRLTAAGEAEARAQRQLASKHG